MNAHQVRKLIEKKKKKGFNLETTEVNIVMRQEEVKFWYKEKNEKKLIKL